MAAHEASGGGGKGVEEAGDANSGDRSLGSPGPPAAAASTSSSAGNRASRWFLYAWWTGQTRVEERGILPEKYLCWVLPSVC
jgi:hypothetical protein